MTGSIMDFAMGMISRNPKLANNPRAQQLISVIQNGDSAQGEKIAENLCQTYGVTKEQALDDAKKFFGIR
jgi:hypothetical protein